MGYVTGGHGADVRVRVRIFAYLRANGLSVTEANDVARRLVFAMVGKGALPASVVMLAGAAVAKAPPGEAKAAVLVEPKAEPYEAGGGGKGFGTSSPSVTLGGLPIRTAGGLRHGFHPGGGVAKGGGGGHQAPVAGAATTFAIIEPIMTRREVQARMSTVLGLHQVQALARDVKRMLPAPR